MIKKLSSVLCVAAIAVGCSDDNNTVLVPEADFELVWSDEFEGEAGRSPDLSRWTFDIGTGPNLDGYGNGQLEYTTDFADNVSLDGEGNLAITARETPFFDRQFTAGRITTKDKFATRLGRIEARMKLPVGQGMWPAFWMLGDTFPDEPWPIPGEIDIMEYRGQDPRSIFGTIHGPFFCGAQPLPCPRPPIGGVFRFDGPEGLDEDFHVYAIEWDAERIAWFVDDVQYFVVRPDPIQIAGDAWVFNQPFFLLLNLAVGGNFVGGPPDETTVFPQTLLVDYVRVFKRIRGSEEPVVVVDVDDGDPTLPTPSALSIAPDDAVLPLGGSQQLLANDGLNEPVTRGVQWSSSNEAIVRVGAAGNVYGVAIGTASVTATINDVSDTVEVVISPDLAPPGFAPLPMVVDNVFPGRSAFGSADGAPLHTETLDCPMRAGGANGNCHRFAWDGAGGGFTGAFWTIGDAFANLGSQRVQAGATDLVFYAWSTTGQETIEFGAGLGANDGVEFRTPIALTTTPTRYTVSLAPFGEYEAVFSPFTWFTDAAANPGGFEFFVDDIQWIRTPPQAPEVGAPNPTNAPNDVISIFSDAYNNVSAFTDFEFDQTAASVVSIAGNDTIRFDYPGGVDNFAVIEFPGQNLTGFTNLRFDVWTAAGATLRVKVVDFGPDAAFGGGDDSEAELTFNASSSPALQNSTWQQFDIPLVDFLAGALGSVENVTQLVFSIDNVEGGPAAPGFFDNIFFYRPASTANAPTTPPPAPTNAAADVISLFSDEYTGVPLSLADPEFDRGTVTVVELTPGQNVRQVEYVGGEGSFAGITFEGDNSLDLTGFDNVRVDVWAPVATQVRVNLVDFGPDNAFEGGDDSNFEITFDATTTPALVNRQWVTFDIPLSDFTGLLGRANVSQIFLSVDEPAQTVFYDNIIFYRAAAPPEAPTVPPPAPTNAAGDVISLFSDEYTDVPLTLADPEFDRGTVTVEELAPGENVRRIDYVGGEGNFAGITFEGDNSLDLTGFDNVRFDVWAPVATQVRVNLVDFGPDNAFEGGDDSRFEITFDATTTPALANRQWVTFDIPLSDFTGLTGRANVSQIFLSVDDPAQTVFYDNIIFYKAVVPSTIISDPADVTIFDQNGSPVFEPAGDLAGGTAFGDTAQGASFVIPFVLPAVPPGGFTAATFRVYVQFTNVNVAMNPMNADLYGLPFRSAADASSGGIVQLTDGYVGATADPGATLLASDFLTPATPAGDAATATDAATDQAIADYLNAQVTAGAVAGDYIYFRLSPDQDPPTPGGTSWTVYTANGPPDFRPSLSLP